MSGTRAGRLAPARAADLPAVRRLLRRCGLPADLETAHGCVVLRSGTGLAGCVALERYGRDGLLRSLAVRPQRRAEGLGGRLVEAVVRRARRSGVLRLWLLTTTADAYFAARGWKRVDRARAPARLRASSQFAGVCPASAVCMVRSLGPDHARSR